METKDGSKKMRILCLHGFRTSGGFLKKQISKWDPSIFAHFDMDLPDGIYPAGGKSEIEGIFPPPYFEWFQFDKDFTEYTNLEACIDYLCDYIGATLAALLLGYQAQGKILNEHPPIKLFVSISGSKFRDPTICEVAYKEPIKVKSVHFIGDKDWLKLPSEELASAFEDPLIIRHPQGHTVPRLDEDAVEKLGNWTMEINVLSRTNTNEASVDIENENTKNDEETKLKEKFGILKPNCEAKEAENGNIAIEKGEAEAKDAVHV
ncbi:hypothetical protein PHJA_000520700 [Phtheirospermum japonicum]|uniref:Serine hydrolase domain-containing protein n=1 Tax=Phtheirospermum japonicum TaxID=374723 RepID=A0A830BCH0_9LAMI|nr:hypothetical protein PHJA_000520700 [Phtheirospermum japonicum]